MQVAVSLCLLTCLLLWPLNTTPATSEVSQSCQASGTCLLHPQRSRAPGERGLEMSLSSEVITTSQRADEVPSRHPSPKLLPALLPVSSRGSKNDKFSSVVQAGRTAVPPDRSPGPDHQAEGLMRGAEESFLLLPGQQARPGS